MKKEKEELDKEQIRSDLTLFAKELVNVMESVKKIYSRIEEIYNEI